MSGIRNTVVSPLDAPPRGSNFLVLPIQLKPVHQPRASSKNEKAQPETEPPDEYSTAKAQYKSKQRDQSIKIKSEVETFTPAPKSNSLKPSIFAQATHAIRSHIAKGSTMNGTGPKPSKGQVVDLTFDSDDEVPPHLTPSPLLRFARVEPQQQQQHVMGNPIQPAGFDQENLNVGAGPYGENQPPQDGFYENDEAYARALQEHFAFDAPIRHFDPHIQLPGPPMAAPAAARTPAATPVPTTGVPQTLEECISILEGVFPDICHDYVSDLFKTTLETADQLIDHILTKSTYPRTKDKQLALKRKRAEDPDEEAARKYGSTDRNIPATPGGVRPYIRTILIAEFPLVPVTFIDSRLQACGFRLFSAYQEIFEAVRTYSSETPVYQRLQKARKVDALFTEETIGGFLTNPNGDTERVEVLTELQTARRVRKKEEDRHEGLLRLQQLEDQNTRQAIAEGAMGECGCCYGDFPLNRLVHCNGETSHEFCKDCARRNAETEVGKSKYELHCMSMDSCTGGFDLDQRAHFLDENTRIALDRNEQESVLRLAGIENLASCPFCPFAAEYPPVEIDREFRCQAPDCERISCRLCSEESHIPQSCEEYKKDKGLCVRRELEEAMSAALIRKCNKCGTPFVKLEGCNKMTCTRNGCNNIQCYVCSKSCGYGHFNDRSRGGKPGNCPLFDNVEERHKGEVSKAEKEALQRILAEHPEYTEDDLKVKISENVKDDDRRKDPRAALDELIRAGALRGVPHFNVPGQDALQVRQRFVHRLNIRQALLQPEPMRYDPPPQPLDPFDEFMDFEAGLLGPPDEPMNFHMFHHNSPHANERPARRN